MTIQKIATKFPLSLLSMIVLLAGCTAYTSPELRRAHSQHIAAQHHWEEQVIEGPFFDLVAFTPQHTEPQSQLVVYLEGDGLAWRDKYHVSSDPTPIRPIGLELALQHPNNNAVYIARPCQYVSGQHRQHCDASAWTSARFSQNVITATHDAIDQLKHRYQANSITLIGYSGGATVALLVAAQRDDVQKIITVAGNLDHQQWAEFHHISPLTDSLNPLTSQKQLQKIAQVHWVGGQDNIVPAQLTQAFIQHFPADAPIKMFNLPTYDHQCCWAKHWPTLFKLSIE